MIVEGYEGLRNNLVDYVRRVWNERHAADEQVERVELFFMHEKTVPYPETPRVERIPIELVDRAAFQASLQHKSPSVRR